MPQPTPDELRSVRFAIARGGEQSYDARQVDDFVDGLVARAEAGAAPAELLDVHFDPCDRPGAGYRAGDVDLLLAQLRSGQPISTPRMEPLAEERGLLGRLFGRR